MSGRCGAALLVASSFLLGACSSLLDADFDHGSDDAGAGAGSDGHSPSDPANGDGDGGTSVDTSGVTREGEVFFSSTPSGGLTASMGFFDVTNSGATTVTAPSSGSCTSLGKSGACVVTNCASGSAVGAGAPATLVSAGNVTISGGSTMLQYVPLSGNSYSYVGAASDATKLLQPNTTVEISAQGSADFPAFTTYFTLLGGGDLTIYSGVTSGSIARSAPLTFGCSASGTLTVTVSAVATVGQDAGPGHTVATCTFNQERSGTLSIPAAVWMYFPPTVDVELTAGVETRTVQRVGDALVTLDSVGAVDFPASGETGLVLGLQ